MVLLIDANIILDVLMNRQEFVKDSSMIWKLCETEKAKGYVSALTFANLVYIMRKQLNPEAIEDVYRKLSLIFTFTDLSVSDLTRAAGQITWERFITNNNDARGVRYKFEDLSRQLFTYEFLSQNKLFKYVHSNPNNPGIESEPILDEVNNRYIGYQTFKEKQKYTPDDVEMIITAGQAIAAEKDSDKDLREKVY